MIPRYRLKEIQTVKLDIEFGAEMPEICRRRKRDWSPDFSGLNLSMYESYIVHVITQYKEFYF